MYQCFLVISSNYVVQYTRFNVHCMYTCIVSSPDCHVPQAWKTQQRDFITVPYLARTTSHSYRARNKQTVDTLYVMEGQWVFFRLLKAMGYKTSYTNCSHSQITLNIYLYVCITLRLTLENSNFWLLQWMMVGWLEQAKTLVTPPEQNCFSTRGFVPRTTRFDPLSWPGEWREQKEGRIKGIVPT